MMNVSQTMETEEDLLTRLHIKFYHPQQNCKGLYGLLPLGNRSRHSADDPLRLGRDAQACTFSLVDAKVSRKQLALFAYRTPHSQDMLFTIQNLSPEGTAVCEQLITGLPGKDGPPRQGPDQVRRV
ncbi:TRAF-interacting protein with FHA domain-containing protein A [Larimichthys crocea]|uniref:Uncharacterized protein n=1 Tax=Larimichthys crocea TaxID=215358 RepID=A0ACD3Q4D7_LARCR|nr:TRAF-interacting protein with FHA domain-containing protein A [Larimichthys crocea]